MLRYQVSDMSCGHCVQAITEAIKSVDSSAEVNIDLAGKSVEVSTSAADGTVRKSIREAGYTPAEAAQAPAPAPARGSCCGGR